MYNKQTNKQSNKILSKILTLLCSSFKSLQHSGNKYRQCYKQNMFRFLPVSLSQFLLPFFFC